LIRAEPTRDKTRFEILEFLNKNENPQSFMNIEKYCTASRNTVKDYLEELKDEDLVEQSLKGRHPYSITENGEQYFKKLMTKRKSNSLIDSLEPEYADTLLESLTTLLNSMEEEGTDPKAYFKSNCLAFIGGTSNTFHKSIEGMQRILNVEKRHEERARKEGLTLEEYIRKIKKKAEKMKGIRRMLTVQGYTEEEIEEMRRKQGGTFKVTRYTRKKS